MIASVRYPTTTAQLFSDISHYMIGGDSIFERVRKFSDDLPNFPPYNIIVEKNVYRLEMALSGYSKESLSVYTEAGNLVVEATKQPEDRNVNYAYRGLSRRSFKWRRAITDEMCVKEAKFENGLLTVIIEKVIPDAHQRKDYL